ncbi:hypothetical protein, partial [Iodidimonas nitroreducens]|uniref:hypothetical protein n=1 Tax=Iodidimonas nitroreducens TaxID=1236968 RepID=UPI0028D0E468
PREIEGLHERQNYLLARVRNVKNDLKTGLSTEEQQRKEEDQKLDAMMKEAVIGGIHIELMGLAFLIFGVLLGTIPEILVVLPAWVYSSVQSALAFFDALLLAAN